MLRDGSIDWWKVVKKAAAAIRPHKVFQSVKDLKSKTPAGSAGKGIWVCTWSVLSLMALHLCWTSFGLFHTCCCLLSKRQINDMDKVMDADYVRPCFFLVESKRLGCNCGCCLKPYKFLTEAAPNLRLRCFSGLFQWDPLWYCCHGRQNDDFLCRLTCTWARLNFLVAAVHVMLWLLTACPDNVIPTRNTVNCKTQL